MAVRGGEGSRSKGGVGVLRDPSTSTSTVQTLLTRLVFQADETGSRITYTPERVFIRALHFNSFLLSTTRDMNCLQERSYYNTLFTLGKTQQC